VIRKQPRCSFALASAGCAVHHTTIVLISPTGMGSEVYTLRMSLASDGVQYV
jgi:hypothetical protein